MKLRSNFQIQNSLNFLIILFDIMKRRLLYVELCYTFLGGCKRMHFYMILI